MLQSGYFFIGFAAGGAVFTVVWLTFHNYFWNGLWKVANDIRSDYWKVCTELKSIQSGLSEWKSAAVESECDAGAATMLLQEAVLSSSVHLSEDWNDRVHKYLSEATKRYPQPEQPVACTTISVPHSTICGVYRSTNNG